MDALDASMIVTSKLDDLKRERGEPVERLKRVYLITFVAVTFVMIFTILINYHFSVRAWFGTGLAILMIVMTTYGLIEN